MIEVGRHGPWAVVAGGSEGIGGAFASELGRAGLNIVLLARSTEPLAERAEAIRRESGVEVRTVAVDLTADDMLGRVRAATDDIAVGTLVYNVGADNAIKPFLERPLEAGLRLIRLNAVGQATLCHHFGGPMAARGAGAMVIVGAMAAFAGAPTHVTYGGLKSFGRTFAEGLWWELRPRGVDVLYVAAGATATPAMTRLGLNDDPDRYQLPEDLAQDALANIANGPLYVPPHLRDHYAAFSTLDRPEGVARMAAFLHSYTGAPELLPPV